MEGKSDITKLLEEIEIKAVKRFADRLKAEIKSIKLHEPRQCWDHDTLDAFETKIDIIIYNLVKEMEGELK